MDLMKILLLVLLASCSFFKKPANERVKGHHRLYSVPVAEDLATMEETQRRLIIFATNDLMGQLEPQQESAQDSHHPQDILVSVGGAEILARHLAILRQRFPKEVVAVDAGGSLTTDAPKAMFDLFDQMNYDAVTLAASDLRAAPKKGPGPWLTPLLNRSATPLVVGNLLDLHSGEPVKWGKTQPFVVKTINAVQVGFLGLLADDVPDRVEAATMNGLYVEPAIQALLKQVRAMRLKGAEAIVLLMHGDLKCGEARAQKLGIPVSKVNFDPKDPAVCSSEGTTSAFLQAMPPGLVDVIVTGGKGKVANWINGVPVVQAFPGGTSFSRVDLIVENKRVLTAKTVVHQPVRLCHRFFKATEDCYTDDQSVDHRELVPATYWGEAIFPEERVSLWMESRRSGNVDEVTYVEAANDRTLDLPGTQP